MKTILKIGRKNYFCEGSPTMVYNFIKNSCGSRIILKEIDNPGVCINVRCRDINIPEPEPVSVSDPVIVKKSFFKRDFWEQLNMF